MGSGDRFRAIDFGQTIWLGSTMNNANEQWVRITSRILLLLLVISGAPDLARAFTPQESVPNHEQQQMPDSAPAPAKQQNELPDSPGVMRAPADASQQSEPQRPSQSFVQGDQKPVGTAAAEAASVRGTGASKPAGMAIAPGRQHQTRSFLIKVGAILGAGAAVGTVMALTMASPGKPPGAR
jgi:hypothetical protein